MEQAFSIAALWFGLALLSTVIAVKIEVSVALVEILVGVAAAAIIGRFFGAGAMGADLPWLKFLAGAGAVLLTFLAGAELEPAVMRRKLKEVSAVGAVSFLGPFLGCAAVARYALGWSPRSSWLAGVVLSDTSVAVTYAAMLQTGFNRTDFGKGILGACFVTDVGTVLALGLLFAPFSWRTAVFAGASVVGCALLYLLTPRLVDRFAVGSSSFRTRWVLFVLFGLGALALWAGSEAVLPAYVVGTVLAATLGADRAFIRRLRTLTVGFLTPIYFLRAGTFVSLPALAAAPVAFVALFAGKIATKIGGIYPLLGAFRSQGKERWYYTLMLSTGLTFGTIAALFGLSNGIVSQQQYSQLVAVVIGSAVVPTLIAGAAFLPRHLLPEPERSEEG